MTITSAPSGHRAVWIGLFLGVLLTGCARLPPRAPIEPSYAPVDDGSTRLGRLARSVSPEERLKSGFRLLPQGEFSFNARIALAERAERSLDVQSHDQANGQRALRTAQPPDGAQELQSRAAPFASAGRGASSSPS